MQATPSAQGLFSLIMRMGANPEAMPLGEEGTGAFSNLLNTLLPPQLAPALPPLEGQLLPPETALNLPLLPAAQAELAAPEGDNDDMAGVIGQLNFGAIQVLSPAAAKVAGAEPLRSEEANAPLTVQEQTELAAGFIMPGQSVQATTDTLPSATDLPEPEMSEQQSVAFLPNEKHQGKQQTGAQAAAANMTATEASKAEAALAASANQADSKQDESMSFALAKADTSISAAQSKGRPDMLSFEQELNAMKEQDKLQLGQDKKQWPVALGGRILTMVAEETHHAKIRLDPPELGSLHVRMQVHHEQVQIQVQVQTPQVREALESQAQRLRDALAEGGMQLSQFDVSQQSSQQQHQGQGQGQGQTGANDGEWLSSAEEDNTPRVAPVNSHTLLDTFA